MNWGALLVVAGIHLGAMLALVGWFFSWTGVALALGGCYVFGTLGINLGFHRLFSHRSFQCPLWVERVLAILGVCSLQKSPAQFVVYHRAHHQFEDAEGDPHSPRDGFFWGHMNWVFALDREFDNIETYERYARDMFRDPFYIRMERNFLWLWTYVAHAVLFWLAGFCCGWLQPAGSPAEGLQLGSSVLVWGVFVRTVMVWHITWIVNSAGHIWGYRTYETRGNSRNSLLLGLLSNGDGWHNNHHADPRAASHGHQWWEFDVAYRTLVVMRFFGLAWDLIPVRVKSSTSLDDVDADDLSAENHILAFPNSERVNHSSKLAA